MPPTRAIPSENLPPPVWSPVGGPDGRGKKELSIIGVGFDSWTMTESRSQDVFLNTVSGLAVCVRRYAPNLVYVGSFPTNACMIPFITSLSINLWE